MKYNKNVFQITILVITALSMIVAIIAMFNDFKVFNQLDSNILLTTIASMVVSVTIIYTIMIIQRINPKQYIYISYSKRDKDIAEIIVSTLENKFQVLSKYRFALLTADNIPYGSNMNDTMKSYLSKSDIVIIVISESYVKSDWCNNEFNRIMQLNKRIIPIITDSFNDLSRLPKNISDIKALSLIDCENSEIEKRLDVLAKELIKQRKD